MYRCINKHFKGREPMILIFTSYKSFVLRKIRKELVARHRARGCKGSLKAVNTKTLHSVKKCKKFLYYKSFNFTKPKSSPTIAHMWW